MCTFYYNWKWGVSEAIKNFSFSLSLFNISFFTNLFNLNIVSTFWLNYMFSNLRFIVSGCTHFDVDYEEKSQNKLYVENLIRCLWQHFMYLWYSTSTYKHDLEHKWRILLSETYKWALHDRGMYVQTIIRQHTRIFSYYVNLKKLKRNRSRGMIDIILTKKETSLKEYK